MVREYIGLCPATTTHGVASLSTAARSPAKNSYCGEFGAKSCSVLNTTMCSGPWSKEYQYTPSGTGSFWRLIAGMEHSPPDDYPCPPNRSSALGESDSWFPMDIM